jgi:hypothetical protein
MGNRRSPGSPSVAAAPSTSAVTMELLGIGEHAGPSHGANILELASVLAGERWSSSPPSAHPALAAAAGTVNDLLPDDRRRLLVPLAPWLLGTRSAGPGAWPAVICVCDRAAAAPSNRPEQPRLRNRRRVERAIRSAQLSWARAGSPHAADALCQLLLDCINECRRLTGEQAVDPRLPLTDCPQHLAVALRFVWSPGCDWMEVGYHPVPGLLPTCLRRETADASKKLRGTTA